jgi:hypothetical protein
MSCDAFGVFVQQSEVGSISADHVWCMLIHFQIAAFSSCLAVQRLQAH